jgi:hypothetical protein
MPSPSTPRKVFIAVHGIGDQSGYETVQSVAARVAAHRGIAPAIPLGRFYPDAGGPQTFRPEPQLMVVPPDPVALGPYGFGEVYWAGIAREPEKAGFILEESKKWARTVSGRLSMRARQAGHPLPLREYERLVNVLDEMIDTIFILDRLNFIAQKAGLLNFNLRALLVDFLGDVQLVADFAAYRQRILAEFNDVMTRAAALDPGRAEIYIVAHSEGTVLAFLALLTALDAPTLDAHRWIGSVKGVMTIGSPIETHHLLWPELWAAPRQALQPHVDAPRNIPWRNYYDYGDPVAYSLSETAAWLTSSGFGACLALREMSFGRYYLPGKAHVDYWQDGDVFEHFLRTVVERPSLATTETSAPAAVAPASAAERAAADDLVHPPPRNRITAIVISYFAPNVLLGALVFLATWLLYRPAAAIVAPAGLPGITVFRDVLGIGVLLLGITAASRLPRLTNQYRWWLVSAAVLLASMLVYSEVTCAGTRHALGRVFTPLAAAPASVGASSVSGVDAAAGDRSAPAAPPRALLPAPLRLRLCTSDTASLDVAASLAKTTGQPALPMGLWLGQVRAATVGVLVVAAMLALLGGLAASWFPAWGMRVLPSLGAIVAFGLVGFLVWTVSEPDAQFWPLLLGIAAFFYLFWLSTLLFDLIFVWHRYIRHSAATVRVCELTKEGYSPAPLEQAYSRIMKGGDPAPVGPVAPE